MTITSLSGLQDALSTGALSAGVSGLLVLLAPLINTIPGFRSNDSTRTVLMRILLYVLTVAAMLALAWTQNIVIPKSTLPTLLGAAAIGAGAMHLFYTSIKQQGATSTATSQPDALTLAQDAVQTAQALGTPASK